MAQRDTQHTQKMEGVEEEKASLALRLSRVEEVRRSKEEALKDAQVELFVERQKAAEVSEPPSGG